MRIVVAPQGFKGTLSGPQAAEAMAEGVRRVLPSAEVVLCPAADAGDVTLDTLLTSGGEAFRATVAGPLGAPVEARWGAMADGVTAVVELAQASGLAPLRPEQLDPMVATTYGTGQLIKAALNAGYRRIVVGMGGSATHDGGMGAAQALGVQLHGGDAFDVGFGAAALLRLAYMDFAGLDPWVHEAHFQIATDVSSPLCGPSGAAMVYAPQKGARPEQLPWLEAALVNLADVIKQDLGLDISDLPGAGAAGGAAAGLLAVLDPTRRGRVELVRGAPLVCDMVGLDAKIQGAALVLTGEGRMDGQTAVGKAPIEVAHRAQAQGVRVVAVAGSLGSGHEAVLDHGVDMVEATADADTSPPATKEEAHATLADATERALRRAQAAGLLTS